MKHIGIGFIFMNSFCAVLGTIIPVAQDFYHFNMIVVSCFAVFVTGCYLIYGRILRDQIIMFLCRV